MNNRMKKIAGVFLAAALMVAGSVNALAADQSSSVSLYLPAGDQAAIQFRNGATSFFDFYDVVPGDTLTQNISIENARSETVTFYLNGTDPSDNTALLREIGLTITNVNTGRTIYNGNLTGRPISVYGDDLYKNSTDQIHGINLGTYRAYQTVNLRAVIHVPVHVDNDFADAFSQVVWQVRAELPDTTTTTGSSSSNSGNSNRDRDSYSTTTADPDDLYRITDNDVPLAGEEYKIADNQIPLAELPKTGGLPIGFIGLAAAGTGGGVLLAGRKKKDQ